MKRRAIFLDKDGTLIRNVPYNIDPNHIGLMPHAGAALRLWQELGYLLIVVSNQSGVALGRFPLDALRAVEHKLAELLAPHDVALDACYWCPHHSDGCVARFAIDCDCRKPQPGLLLRAAREYDIDLSASWMIGDILHDVEAGKRAGCRSILVDTGGETEWDCRAPLRRPDFVATDLLSAAQYVAERPFANASTEGEPYHASPT